MTLGSFGATKPAVRLSPNARTRLARAGVEREEDGTTASSSSSSDASRIDRVLRSAVGSGKIIVVFATDSAVGPIQ